MSKIWLLLIVACLSVQAQTFEKDVEIPAPKDSEDRYSYIPFEVPTNAKNLSIELDYDKKAGLNVLDLGLFDSRFDESKKTLQGFRGWSGGRRNVIFISEKQASHGYLPGKIPSGKWQIILGLYKVVPEGVKVSIKVKINEIDNRAENEFLQEKNVTYTIPPLKKSLAAANFGGYRWYRGDLHIHTFYSDGNWTFPTIFDWATAAGLDFIGLTEHNTAAHHSEINFLAPKYKNLLILRGEEVTTYGGHFNVWGLPTDNIIDFRITPKNTSQLEFSLKEVRKLGLLASINHPTGICGGCNWSYGDWTKLNSVEIWNGSWDVQDENALKLWDELLQKNQRITAIGSSDTHRPPTQPSEYSTNLPLGFPTNHIGMKDKSQTELLSAIKDGRVWISNEPNNYELEFSVKIDFRQLNIGEEIRESSKNIVLNLRTKNIPSDSLVRLISNGEIISNQKINDVELEYKLAKEFKVEKDSYFRVEIRSSDNKMIALTNPIFIKVKR